MCRPQETEDDETEQSVGVAFVAMSLLTGFAINTAHAADCDGIICDDEREIIVRDEERV